MLRESLGIRWICEVNRGRAGFGLGGGKEGGRRRGREFICTKYMTTNSVENLRHAM